MAFPPTKILVNLSRRLYIRRDRKTTYGGTFNNERDAVKAAIRARHKTRLGMVEAVVGFTFTVGTDETNGMASKQARRYM